MVHFLSKRPRALQGNRRKTADYRTATRSSSRMRCVIKRVTSVCNTQSRRVSSCKCSVFVHPVHWKRRTGRTDIAGIVKQSVLRPRRRLPITVGITSLWRFSSVVKSRSNKTCAPPSRWRTATIFCARVAFVSPAPRQSFRTAKTF